MSTRPIYLATALAALGLVLAACSGAAPAATPVKQAPASTAGASTQPAAPETPASQPAKAAAPKSTYPEKGKTIKFIVPYAAGGASDISARSIAPFLEKDLGAVLPIVNEAAAGSQAGLTSLAKANPDGYTIAQAALPSNLTVYLDPQRQAAFGRKDLQMVANYGVTPVVVAVKADSPFKSAKDLVEAAKAKPEDIGVADTGLLSVNHLGTLILQKAAGIKLKAVHFEGGGPAMNALLGGHVDVITITATTMMAQLKAGQIRVLGVMSDQRNQFLPDQPTFAEQGYKANIDSSYGIIVPGGTPANVVSTLSASIKKAVDSDDFKKRLTDQGQTPSYMDTQQYSAYWDKMASDVEPLISLAR